LGIIQGADCVPLMLVRRPLYCGVGIVANENEGYRDTKHTEHLHCTEPFAFTSEKNLTLQKVILTSSTETLFGRGIGLGSRPTIVTEWRL
jgi:hypothetical protein